MTRPVKIRSYRRIHARRQERYGPASAYACEGCCGRSASDWATLHPVERHAQGEVLWTDFVPLCRSCHLIYDDNPERRAKAADKNRGQRRTPDQRRRIAEGRKAVKARLPEKTDEYHSQRVAAGRSRWAGISDQERSAAMRKVRGA